MFFFLSKTLNFLTTPLVVICLLLTLAGVLRSKRWKQRTFWAGLVLLLTLSNDFILNETMLRWEIPVIPFVEVKKQYEWGIILTGVTKSQTGPGDRVYFNRGADRITHAVQLYKLGLIKHILVSGGSGMLVDIGVKEGDEIASALVLMGIPSDHIIVERESRNTRENAVNSIQILKPITTPENCLLITSAFHMRRAAACFAKAGWPVDQFSTDFLSHFRNYSAANFLIPHIEALLNWHYLIKEWIGYTAYKIAGYI